MTYIAVFLVLLVVAALLYGLFVQGTLKMPKKKKPKTPAEEMQEQIDARSTALKKANDALEKSGIVVRQSQRDVKQSQADVNTLNAKIEQAIKDKNEGEAKRLIQRLTSEEAELDQKKTRLKQALATHEFYREEVVKQRVAIEEAKRDAEQVSVRLELAEAEKAYKQAGDLDGKAAALKIEADKAEISVRAARPPQDEFDKAAQEAEVEDRLAAFKKKAEG
jgi:chromosome segregation ATPase